MSTTPRVDGSASAHRRARVSRSCSNLNDGQLAWPCPACSRALAMSAIGTFETCRPALPGEDRKSWADRQNDANDPEPTSWSAKSSAGSDHSPFQRDILFENSVAHW